MWTTRTTPRRPERPAAWAPWGTPEHAVGLPRHVHRTLAERGLLRPGPPRPTARPDLPPTRLEGAALDALVGTVSRDHVRTDDDARATHAGGRSYTDLLRRRAGDPAAPDAVVSPADHDEVRAVLEACARHRVAVVPTGGGTSVVGGLEPLRGGLDAVVALDLHRLDRLLAVDPVSLTATLGAGLRTPAAEAALAPHGLTLGHTPQSWEMATVGGYVATRSAGQASTGYGRVEDMVVGLTCATPVGDLDLGRGPASAAGPRLLDVLVGSEGAYGVVTSATLAVHRRPEAVVRAGWSFPSFAHGVEAFRALAQDLRHGWAPDVCRLSDEEETATTLALAGGSAGARALRGYLAARGRAGGVLAVLGWEGTADDVRTRRRAAARLLRRHGGLPLGAGPGRAWERGRFHGPYLRDALLDHDVLVETLETATTWADLPALHAALRSAVRAALPGQDPIVQVHVSHLYRTGASLYLTVVGRQDDDPVAQWARVKRAASDTIAAHGATATHHHAVGVDHLPWVRAEVGDVGVRVLRAVKEALDPDGVLNPGKLVPPG
ncbi:FAD-binding oxidoreductase [Thalassiella azotivora]